jgi:hypothetical protein
MITYKEIVLRENNTFLRRTITDEEFSITNEVVAAMASDLVLTVRTVFGLPNDHGPVNLSLGRDRYYTVMLSHLSIKTAWIFFKDKNILTPNFGSGNVPPVMTMKWYPPAEMELYAVFNLDVIGTILAVYLLAYHHEDKTWWRLPLGNLYDDGKVCMGRTPNPSSTSDQDTIVKWLAILEQSQWNADLWNSVEKTQRLFQFKPLKDSGFEQVPLPKDVNWMSLCDKIGPAILNRVIVV